MKSSSGKTFHEFFAGGGMARLGLGAGWRCVFANDNHPVKCAAYRDNFGADHLAERDVGLLTLGDLPKGRVDLSWASFPCQSLSVAGQRAGMGYGTRSGAYWAYWRLIEALAAAGRPPKVIVLENVTGLLTSDEGGDFRRIFASMMRQGYRSGALVVDAVKFLPQSRPRVFIIAVHRTCAIPPGLLREGSGWANTWSVPALDTLAKSLRSGSPGFWLDWNLPDAPPRSVELEDIFISSSSHKWFESYEHDYLLFLMSDGQRAALDKVSATGMRTLGTGFRRGRSTSGEKIQRFEVRWDGNAGCLRVPSGGSSRQMLIEVEGSMSRTRHISPGEGARLMGLPDTYILPLKVNDALHLIGDGVAVPVVSWIAKHIINPVVEANHVADNRISACADEGSP